jgi:hypothetical protein
MYHKINIDMKSDRFCDVQAAFARQGFTYIACIIENSGDSTLLKSERYGLGNQKESAGKKRTG